MSLTLQDRPLLCAVTKTLGWSACHIRAKSGTTDDLKSVTAIGP